MYKKQTPLKLNGVLGLGLEKVEPFLLILGNTFMRFMNPVTSSITPQR